MKQCIAFIATVIVGWGLIQQTVLADTTTEACKYRPYVGVCPQGCDEDGQQAPEVTAQRVEAPKITIAQVNCNITPYLSPSCADSE